MEFVGPMHPEDLEIKGGNDAYCVGSTG
eukprot:SAG22_NODE_21082_length_260_cov_0.645963_2_plen_27_part_01